MSQGIGTRIFYGEPASGPGLEFTGASRKKDFVEYIQHQVNCYDLENIDINSPEFEGCHLFASKTSVNNMFSDFGSPIMYPGDMEDKGYYMELKGLKIIINIRNG